MLFIEVKLLREVKEKELVLWYMKVEEYMKESGLMIKDMEWDMKDIKMGICIKGNLKEGKLMDKENTYGKIVENSMKEVG
jgi:hypothetical protein